MIMFIEKDRYVSLKGKNERAVLDTPLSFLISKLRSLIKRV